LGSSVGTVRPFVETANGARQTKKAVVRDDGLLSYGTDRVDTFRRAASYVDRILRGEKPAELPVQFPTKFEMVVNRKAAKALGLAIPPSIMLRADEVIE
jgi:putative ABC transport system substrate-binding protein